VKILVGVLIVVALIVLGLGQVMLAKWSRNRASHD